MVVFIKTANFNQFLSPLLSVYSNSFDLFKDFFVRYSNTHFLFNEIKYI